MEKQRERDGGLTAAKWAAAAALWALAAYGLLHAQPAGHVRFAQAEPACR